ncbi:VQ motif-containing protein 20 [Cynara cardunculus var. scolymus]|uniref:VQ motif-containing protein 20 n=1 Tax=Cynara cardunculus var. scolymus TaxID=59895 RepID=UPI000D627240|nr:VQ motif-containing protein 20 [Cynara cardunculus var. scolymus]
MGPATQFHAKQEQHDVGYDQTPPLKINKDTNFISRMPPSTTAASSTTTTTISDKQPPRRPVIIYTHSPKVIHTHPRDFMALVQKLTGYTPPPEETQPTQDRRHHHLGRGGQGNTEDNESTSVVTEEHGSSVNDIPQVNSCFVDGGVGVAVAPPPYRSAVFDPYFNPTPVFPANPTEFLCTPSHQLPFYNPDSLFMNRNSLSSSSSTLRVLKEYPDI